MSSSNGCLLWKCFLYHKSNSQSATEMTHRWLWPGSGCYDAPNNKENKFSKPSSWEKNRPSRRPNEVRLFPRCCSGSPPSWFKRRECRLLAILAVTQAQLPTKKNSCWLADLRAKQQKDILLHTLPPMWLVLTLLLLLSAVVSSDAVPLQHRSGFEAPSRPCCSSLPIFSSAATVTWPVAAASEIPVGVCRPFVFASVAFAATEQTPQLHAQRGTSSANVFSPSARPTASLLVATTPTPDTKTRLAAAQKTTPTPTTDPRETSLSSAPKKTERFSSFAYMWAAALNNRGAVWRELLQKSPPRRGPQYLSSPPFICQHSLLQQPNLAAQQQSQRGGEEEKRRSCTSSAVALVKAASTSTVLLSLPTSQATDASAVGKATLLSKAIPHNENNNGAPRASAASPAAISTTTATGGGAVKRTAAGKGQKTEGIEEDFSWTAKKEKKSATDVSTTYSSSALEELLEQQEQLQQLHQQQHLRELSKEDTADEELLLPLAAHGPEDSPVIHVPGVWHFFFPRCLYSALQQPQQPERIEEIDRLQPRLHSEGNGTSNGNGMLAKKRAASAVAKSRSRSGLFGRKDYKGPELVFLYEDHSAIIPALFARGNWALVQPPSTSSLQNHELRLCLFSSRAAHERLLLRGIFAFSQAPVISLWEERVQLHAAQAAGPAFFRTDATAAAAAAAAALPPHVQVLNASGQLLLEGSSVESTPAAATTRARKVGNGNSTNTTTISHVGSFTAYRVLGEESNHFKIQHFFVQFAPKKLYSLVDPNDCLTSAAAAAESSNTSSRRKSRHRSNRKLAVIASSFLKAKHPFALNPSLSETSDSVDIEGGVVATAIQESVGDGKEVKRGHQERQKEKQEETQKSEVTGREDPFSAINLQRCLEKVLQQMEEEPPEEVVWPLPSVPKMQTEEDDEFEEEDIA